MLNFSSRLKERYLCNPKDASAFFKASDYFYRKDPTSLNKMNTTSISLFNYTSNLTLATPQEIANYNMASTICKISKRQFISDAEFLSKEINYPLLSNYVRFFVNFKFVNKNLDLIICNP